MIILLGASGYIGQAFAQSLRQRQLSFAALSRKDLDYARFDLLLNFLREKKPGFLINAAGYTGKPNVDACEAAKADTLAASALLPVLAVNDRLPAKIADKIAKVACSSQNWPNYDRSCQFDLRHPDGAVVNVRVLDLGRQGSRI